jgi:hypothetical protein
VYNNFGKNPMRKLLFVATLLAPIAVNAQTAPPPKPHTINMTTILKDENGRPLIDQFEAVTDTTKNPPSSDCSKCGPLTIGHAIYHSLLASLPQEQSVTAEQRWARGMLAERVKDSTDATLTANEVTVIKKVVGELYGTNVLLQIYPLLDPNAKPPEVQ